MIEIPFKKGQRIKHKNNKDVALKIIELTEAMLSHTLRL